MEVISLVIRDSRFVYAVYPFDHDGDVLGVYVGSTWDVATRITGHLGTYKTHKDLHDAMRNNGYFVAVLDVFKPEGGNVVEYDWINCFIESGANVFNKLTRKVYSESIKERFDKLLPLLNDDIKSRKSNKTIKNYTTQEYRFYHDKTIDTAIIPEKRRTWKTYAKEYLYGTKRSQAVR